MKDGMKARSDSPSRATEEAAEWSVLLLDDPDDRDLRRRFEAWRRLSTENASAWTDIQQTAALAADALPAYAQEWKPMVAAASARKAKSRRRWLVPAVSMALAATVAWMAIPVAMLHLEADHLTGTAELKTIRLQDGSAVTLGPDSAIAVSLTAAARDIRLLKGEAFFDVTSDPNRRFQVSAQSVQASVLGTRFDVRLDGAGVMVAVEEGRVLVEASGGRETLERGQAAQVASSGRIAREDVEAASVAMWRQQLVYLKNRPLSEAVNEIRRYFPGRIVVTESSLEQQPTTGVFDMKDPEAALRGLAQAHGATVRRVSPWLLVVSGS
jgi:transmembrane sensor